MRSASRRRSSSTGDADFVDAGPRLADELRAHVSKVIGPVARPAREFVVPELPKTRSGKILRRLLADITDERPWGDTTSLQDEAVPHRITSIVAAGRALV